MRILLANFFLRDIGGTEKWTYAMAQELQRQGHDVEVFTCALGVTAEKIAELDIPVMARVPMGREYDLQLINHNRCLGLLERVPGLKVYTCHGPQHPLEMPISGAHEYVGVSEEVRATYAPFISRVVHNGVNLEEFSRFRVYRLAPRVLSMAKAAKANAMVEEACKRVGYDFTSRHYLEEPEWDVASMMHDAEIVVGAGRTAYEALAAGCEVLQFDWRDQRGGTLADGWLTPSNVDYLRYFNCAGRGMAMKWEVDDIALALKNYTPMQWGAEWARGNADIRDKATQYLEIADARAGQEPEVLRVGVEQAVMA